MFMKRKIKLLQVLILFIIRIYNFKKKIMFLTWIRNKCSQYEHTEERVVICLTLLLFFLAKE